VTSFNDVFGGSLIYPSGPTFVSLALNADVVLSWPTEQSPGGTDIVADIVEALPSQAGLTVQLSDARSTSNGYTALFNNIGAFSFSILDAVGNLIVDIAPGTVWQIYLADNTTLAGTWRTFQYGAGVSSANAASLAGYGLKAITTTLNGEYLINDQDADYVIQASDRASVVVWTSGVGTFTLPSASAVGAGFYVLIKNSGTGLLTVDPQSPSTIDGNSSMTFAPDDSAIVMTDGTNWVTVGFGQQLNSIFDFIQINLGGTTGNYVLSGVELNRIAYRFTGALAGNVTVIVPNTIQQYWVDNETTGIYTLGVATAGNAGPLINQAARNILFCDGVNVYTAVTFGSTGFADGTVAAPSITFTSDTTLGFYKVAAEEIGLASSGKLRFSVDGGGHSIFYTTDDTKPNLVAERSDGNAAFQILANAASATAMLSLTGNNGTVGTTDLQIFQNGADNTGNILNKANAALKFGTNGSLTMVLGGASLLGLSPTNQVGILVQALAGAGEIALQGAEVSNRAWRLGSGAAGAGEFDIFDETASATRLLIDTTGLIHGAFLQTGGQTNPTIGSVFIEDNTLDGILQKISLANFETQLTLSSLSGQVTSAQVPSGAVTQYAGTLLANAALTGVPTAPTAALGTDTTQIATTAFVNAAISGSSGIVQGGTFSAAASASGTINFSTPFPNNITAVVVSYGSSATDGNSWVPRVFSATRTGFGYKADKLDPDSNLDPTVTWQWIAVGN
jgi:hypothetical protein